MHPPHTIATANGHLDQKRQGLDSTSAETTLADTDTSPSAELPPPYIQNPDYEPPDPHTVYVKTTLASDTNHSDLTGRFPIISTSGNQYLLVSTMDGYIRLAPVLSVHNEPNNTGIPFLLSCLLSSLEESHSIPPFSLLKLILDYQLINIVRREILRSPSAILASNLQRLLCCQ